LTDKNRDILSVSARYSGLLSKIRNAVEKDSKLFKKNLEKKKSIVPGLSIYSKLS